MFEIENFNLFLKQIMSHLSELTGPGGRVDLIDISEKARCNEP